MKKRTKQPQQRNKKYDGKELIIITLHHSTLAFSLVTECVYVLIDLFARPRFSIRLWTCGRLSIRLFVYSRAAWLTFCYYIYVCIIWQAHRMRNELRQFAFAFLLVHSRSPCPFSISQKFPPSSNAWYNSIFSFQFHIHRDIT